VEVAARAGSEPRPASVRVHTKFPDRSFPRAGMCAAAVALFDAPSEVRKPYVEVAQVSPSRDRGREPSPDVVERAERNQAAKD